MPAPQQPLLFPFLQSEIAPAPEVLFKEGDTQILKELPEKGLAIVGTRAPSPWSLRFLQEQIERLPKDFIIVSGLARGIDAQAHLSALKSGLRTVAVLGGGLEHPYPRETFPLREKILNSGGGLLITEYPSNTPARAHQFLNRNRIIAALSKAVWVVEAPIPSGSLNTANWAYKMGIDTYATPAKPDDPLFQGCARLLELGQAIPFLGIQSLSQTWLSMCPLKVDSQIQLKAQSVGASPITIEIMRCVVKNPQYKEERFLPELLSSLSAYGWSFDMLYPAWKDAIKRLYYYT